LQSCNSIATEATHPIRRLFSYLLNYLRNVSHMLQQRNTSTYFCTQPTYQ